MPSDQPNKFQLTAADVGCGISASLCYLRGLGFNQTICVDTNEAALEFQSKINPLGSRIQGFFPEISMPQAPDLIVAFHVLEHVSDPIEWLSELNKISKKPSLLLLEVPRIYNSGYCLENPFTTWNMFGMGGGIHLHQFSDLSISLALAKAGWRLVTLRSPMNNKREAITLLAIAGEQDELAAKVWQTYTNSI